MSEQPAGPEKKLPRESWQSFAERKIREAQQSGAFERLPGFGQPIPGIERPLEENWWIREKLRREAISVLPPILEVRLKIEKTLAELGSIRSEYQLRRRIEALNAEVRRAHYSHIPGPADGVRPLNVEHIVERWRELQGGRS